MKPLLAFRQQDGELLRRTDFAGEANAVARRRAVHVRVVHRTWGVALGFTLAPSADRRAVAVGPGFGYDCRGGEIISPSQQLVPMPSVEEPAELVVRNVCGVQFRWRQPGRACDDELVLGTGYFNGGQIVGVEETGRVCCRGPGSRVVAGIAEQQLARKMTLDASAAGFRTVPLYFATLESTAQLAATLEIRSETKTGFQLTLRAPAKQWREINKQNHRARVHWVGVEQPPRCVLTVHEEDQ